MGTYFLNADSKAEGYDRFKALSLLSDSVFFLLSGSIILAIEKFKVLAGGEGASEPSGYIFVEPSEDMVDLQQDKSLFLNQALTHYDMLIGRRPGYHYFQIIFYAFN